MMNIPTNRATIGEGHEELVEEGEVLLEVGLLVGRMLRARQGVEARARRGDCRLDALGQLGRRHARGTGDEHAVVAARLGEQLLGGGVVGGDQ